jgi:transposase
MFVKITKSGPRQYIQLVEAFRDADGTTRHRHIANLGRVDESKGKLDRLIDGLSRVAGRAPPEAPTFERSVEVGGPWVLSALWNRLGLSRCLRGLTRADAKLDLDALTRVMVINRLCDADSKLGVLRWLEEVIVPGVTPAEVTHQRLLRAMDVLEANHSTILSRLAGLVRPLLDQDLNLVFYDLTNVRSHGETDLDGDLRAYGLSKETGGIARQFSLGLVQSGCGMPLDFEVFPGNIGEVSTLLPMIQRSLARYAVKRVVLVADRGMLSLDQIQALEALKLPKGVALSWIIAVPARRYNDFMDPVVALSESLDQAKAPTVAETKSGEYRLVVAHDPAVAAEQSAARRAKIDAIEALAQAAVDKLERQDQGKKARGRKASDRGAFLRFVEAVKDAHLSKVLKADLAADSFSWHLDETALKRQEAFDGKLILLTNVGDLTSAEVVERYKRLADIERGFRVLKQDIALAPVYHRLPERIRAHALICFLALLLHRVMRPKLTDFSPGAALHKLKAIQLHRFTAAGQPMSGLTATSDETRTIFQQLDLPLPDQKHLGI